MDDKTAPAVAMAVLAGVFGAVQPELNAILGDRVGSVLVASLVNFCVAFAVVLIALGLRPSSRRKLRDVRRWPVPRWTLTAGLGGAIVVLVGALAVDTIGVAIFSIAFFAGQIAFGLVIDRVGIAPGGRRPITAAHAQAVALALAAVVMAQVGEAAGELAPGLVALSVLAGAAVAFQSAFNGRIARATGDPVAATALNVIVGLSALLLVAGATAFGAGFGSLDWPTEPWLYLGGALGVTIVLTLAVATSVLGVLRTTLAMLAAQLVVAFAIDWLVRDDPPIPGQVASAVLIVAAVALIGRPTDTGAGSRSERNG